MSAELGPVFDQGSDTRTCYAHVAADMLTLDMRKRKLLGSNDRIHPLSLSGLYLLDVNRSPYFGGRETIATPRWVFNALKSKNKQGFSICTEAELGASSDYKHPVMRKSAAIENEIFRNHVGQIQVENSCDLKGAGSEQTEALTVDVWNATSKLWLNELKTTCRTKIPPIQPEGIYFDEKYEILSKNRQVGWNRLALLQPRQNIDKALENGGIAGIEFQASFLRKDRKALMHWASVVARKAINGVCQYKIRNSEGSDCSQYVPQFHCESDGTVWVPETELLKYVSTVNYLR